MIKIKALSKKYKKSTHFAVDALDLDISSGGIFGVLGPNGAGKTTLISMLCGLIKPTSGNFSINGMNYQENRMELKQSIGVVPQEYSLYPSLTAWENLQYFGAMYGIPAKELGQLIEEQLKNNGLEDFTHKKIKSFSGGMKRRVNLIAGILHQPKVLFLDEPTVGVDVHSKAVIIQNLKKINKTGTTIIYTSHHLREAEFFCDTVAIIDHGKIISVDKPEVLIQNTPNAIHLEDVFLSLTGIKLRDYA
ncbi:MAG TPA: ABC transporter ATP-binding protein [Flavobacteriaceae bacterium]|nr:ABC transporter ATP-binding protein [Flavobacteriaceae bacterium]